jgi:hypothetical protein
MPVLRAYLNEPVQFSFDTGPAPAEGQSWKIDRELNILGIPVRVDTATWIDLNGTPAFELTVRLPPAPSSLQFGLEDSPGIEKPPTPTSSGVGGGGCGGVSARRSGDRARPAGHLRGGRAAEHAGRGAGVGGGEGILSLINRAFRPSGKMLW